VAKTRTARRVIARQDAGAVWAKKLGQEVFRTRDNDASPHATSHSWPVNARGLPES